MWKKQLFLIIISIICLSIYGQGNRKKSFYKNYSDSIESVFKIRYQIPKGFDLVDTLITWSEEGVESIGGFGYRPVMQSHDKKCLLSYGFSPLYFPTTEGLFSDPNGAFFREANLAHRNNFMLDMSYMLNTRDFNPKDYLLVQPQKNAKQWFNADSIFVFDILPLKQPIVLNGTVYRRATKMFVSRRDRAYMQFVLFFNDETDSKKMKYFSKLKKNIWYHDAEWTFDMRRWQNAIFDSKKS